MRSSLLGECFTILCSLRIEPTDFGGVDFGNGNRNGVFAVTDFLVVLTIAQFARDVGFRKFLQDPARKGNTILKVLVTQIYRR